MLEGLLHDKPWTIWSIVPSMMDKTTLWKGLGDFNIWMSKGLDKPRRWCWWTPNMIVLSSMGNRLKLPKVLMGKRVSTIEKHNYHFSDYSLFLWHCHRRKYCGVALQAYGLELWMEGWEQSKMVSLGLQLVSLNDFSRDSSWVEITPRLRYMLWMS